MADTPFQNAALWLGKTILQINTFNPFFLLATKALGCGGEQSVDDDKNFSQTSSGVPKTASAIAHPDVVTAERIKCHVGEMRSCGACDLGKQYCGADGFWESSCLLNENDRYKIVEDDNPDGLHPVGECHVYGYCSFAWEWIYFNEYGGSEEICDSKDNDCDGMTDEGDDGMPLTGEIYPFPPETKWVSFCRPGWGECQNGAWVETTARYLGPGTEICDRIDDDCDGMTDEDRVCGGVTGDSCHLDGPFASDGPVESSDCATGFCIDFSDYTGGYCSEWGYRVSESCPLGADNRPSVSVKQSALGVDTVYYPHISDYNFGFCVVTCEQDSDCRTEEGYICKPIQQSAFKACLPSTEEVRAYASGH
ncbi:MAG: MopE-related protein [Deltaproteobacteria bacterium]|nr:MopE-related protein [Deltaproteobacteria bacterium]